MSPVLDPKYVPKPWRSAYALALFAFAVLAAGGTAAAVVRVEVGRVVDEKWSEKFRAEVKSIAADAATSGARDAVSQVMRETILPLKERLDKHEPLDDKRVERLETTVGMCCPVSRPPASYFPPR